MILPKELSAPYGCELPARTLPVVQLGQTERDTLMKMKKIASATALLTIFLLPGIALAQGVGGCVDSPENPTAVLALVGGLSGVITFLRRRR